MKKYIYKIEPAYKYGKKTIYRATFQVLRKFLWIKWYGTQQNNYIDQFNNACLYKEAFVTETIEEIKDFIAWCEKVDEAVEKEQYF